MTDRMPTDTLPGEMHEARNAAIAAAAKALWQEGVPRDSELPDFTAAECQAFARIAVNAAWDSLGPLFQKLIAREPRSGPVLRRPSHREVMENGPVLPGERPSELP